MTIGQVKRIREPIDIKIPCRSKIRKWAFDNAYILITMMGFFIITWIYLVIDRLTR